MSEDSREAQGAHAHARPPHTGHPEADAALAPVEDLRDAPLEDHHARLAAAHETLHGLLDKATRTQS